MEFWLSGSDVPTPGKSPSPTKDMSPTRLDTPPGPPTPEKHVTINPSTDEDERISGDVCELHLTLEVLRSCIFKSFARQDVTRLMEQPKCCHDVCLWNGIPTKFLTK